MDSSEVGCPACAGLGSEDVGAVTWLCWLCVGRRVVLAELAERYDAGAERLREHLEMERSRARALSVAVDESDAAS